MAVERRHRYDAGEHADAKTVACRSRRRTPPSALRASASRRTALRAGKTTRPAARRAGRGWDGSGSRRPHSDQRQAPTTSSRRAGNRTPPTTRPSPARPSTTRTPPRGQPGSLRRASRRSRRPRAIRGDGPARKSQAPQGRGSAARPQTMRTDRPRVWPPPSAWAARANRSARSPARDRLVCTQRRKGPLAIRPRDVRCPWLPDLQIPSKPQLGLAHVSVGVRTAGNPRAVGGRDQRGGQCDRGRNPARVPRKDEQHAADARHERRGANPAAREQICDQGDRGSEQYSLRIVRADAKTENRAIEAAKKKQPHRPGERCTQDDERGGPNLAPGGADYLILSLIFPIVVCCCPPTSTVIR